VELVQPMMEDRRGHGRIATRVRRL
jgi:hypothetical protein